MNLQDFVQYFVRDAQEQHASQKRAYRTRKAITWGLLLLLIFVMLTLIFQPRLFSDDSGDWVPIFIGILCGFAVIVGFCFPWVKAAYQLRLSFFNPQAKWSYATCWGDIGQMPGHCVSLKKAPDALMEDLQRIHTGVVEEAYLVGNVKEGFTAIEWIYKERLGDPIARTCRMPLLNTDIHRATEETAPYQVGFRFKGEHVWTPDEEYGECVWQAIQNLVEAGLAETHPRAILTRPLRRSSDMSS